MELWSELLGFGVWKLDTVPHFLTRTQTTSPKKKDLNYRIFLVA